METSKAPAINEFALQSLSPFHRVNCIVLMSTKSGPRGDFVSKVRDLALHNHRFLWLLKYLQRDQQFLDTRLSPIHQGRTRTIIADFPESTGEQPYIDVFAGARHNQALSGTLAVRDAKTRVRLVFITSIAGVAEDVRKQVCNTHNIEHRS
jgi:hypothetical protein